MPDKNAESLAVFVPVFKLCLAFFLVACAAAQAAPARIVSTSLCADSYILALADNDTVAALSWQGDTALSSAPKAWRGKAKGQASAEVLAALRPDFIIMGPGDAPRAARFEAQDGVPVVMLDWASDFAGVFKNMKKLAPPLPAPDAQARIDSTISALQARLAVVRERSTARVHTPRLLYLAPNGASAGPGTFIDAMIKAAGGVNHAATLGVKGWGLVPVEKLAIDPPDMLITGFFKNGYPSAQNGRTRQPVFRKILNTLPRIDLPGKLLVCASPLLVEATEITAAGLDGFAAGGGS